MLDSHGTGTCSGIHLLGGLSDGGRAHRLARPAEGSYLRYETFQSSPLGPGNCLTEREPAYVGTRA